MSEIWSINGRITEREKLKYSKAKVSQYHFANNKSEVNWHVSNPSGVVNVYLQIHIRIFHMRA